jgi:hypothetical protein
MACRGAGSDRTENKDDAEDKVDGLHAEFVDGLQRCNRVVVSDQLQLIACRTVRSRKA